MLNSNVAAKLGISGDTLKNVKNIIFDLGNVIVDIHYDRTLEAFRKLGFSNFDKLYSLYKQTDLFTNLETGKISGDEFCKGLQQNGLELSNQDIKVAWSLMIGDLTVETYQLLKNIRKSYRTFLLSNTNEIHIDHFTKVIKDDFGKDILPEMFEKLYYSHSVHMRKPNIEIYTHVLNDAGLKPEETIFVDDLAENIEASKKAGILGYHLEKEKIQELFN